MVKMGRSKLEANMLSKKCSYKTYTLIELAQRCNT